MREFTSIVLSGGAFKTMSIIGVIKYLEEYSLIKNIKNLVGSSAGSIICYLIALGLCSDEIIELGYSISENDELLQFNIDDICSLLDTYGIDSGERLDTLFRMVLQKKLFRKDITFLEFAKTTGKNLVICVANLTKEESEFWSVDTMPNMSVIKALRISCSVPIIFKPIKYNDMFYVDGGLYNNFPISYFKNDKLKDIIGINIIANNYQDTSDFMRYLRFIIYSVTSKINLQPLSDIRDNVITINFNDEDQMTLNDLKLSITKETINKLIKMGYDTIKNYYNNLSNATERSLSETN